MSPVDDKMRGQEGRFSPVTVRGRERIGKGGSYLFDQLAALGRSIAPDGTFRRIPGVRYIGVRVTRDKRRECLPQLGVSDKRVTNALRDWEKKRMAHRCGVGVDVLFLEPHDGAAARCPGCGAALAESPVSRDMNSRHAGGASRLAGQGDEELKAASSANADLLGAVYGDEEGDGQGYIEVGEAKAVMKERRRQKPEGPRLLPEEAKALSLAKEMPGARGGTGVKPISDRDWLGIKAAARRRDWQEAARRAEVLGLPLVAEHSRRAAFSRDSLRTITYALLLDRPNDEPDPFADDGLATPAKR